MSNRSYSDTVNRIVLRVACEEGRESSPQKKKPRADRTLGSNGPLTQQELSELSLLCSKSSEEENSFASVEGDQVLALLELLDRHINSAVAVNLIPEALELLETKTAGEASAATDKWFKQGGAGYDHIQTLRMGLEAACIIVCIATSPGVDRRAINEDAIEAAVSLMRLHLRQNLVPALNETGHLLKAASSNGADTPTTAMSTDVLSSPPSKKRRRSSVDPSSLPLTKNLKKVYKKLLSTLHWQILLMERLQHLIHDLPLDDQQILMLTNGVLPSFQIDSSSASASSLSAPPGQQLQVESMAILAAAFRRYPKHRDTMIEDLFPIILTLPSTKKSLRTYELRYTSAAYPDRLAALNGSVIGELFVTTRDTASLATSSSNPPRYIQTMTALVVTLIQACVQQPAYHQINDQNEQQDSKNGIRWSSGMDGCQMAVDSFVSELLRRCSRGKHEGSSEFRPFLTHFVEDLLTVMLIPEFPAAELVLSSLTSRLCHDLNRAATATKGQQAAPEATYLTVAFDALGKIFAVQARVLALHRGNGIELTTTEPVAPNDSETRVGCYCGNVKTDREFAIGCEHCQTFYHGRCVGVVDASNVPDEWFCDACRLGKILGREKAKYQRQRGMVDYIDEEFAIRLTRQSSLAHRLGVDGMADATKVHMAQWLDDLENSGKTKGLTLSPQTIVNELLQFWSSPGPTGEQLSGEGTNRVMLYLAAKTSPLMLSFRNQIRFLLKLMSDGSHLLRKLSLKTIEKTVEGDSTLMLMPIITKAVSRRLSDDSISVREAAVSLVGSYVVRSPAVANTFHNALLSCLEDTGISVRKRAVKIFQSILTSIPSYKGRAAVCDVMLQRAADPKEEDGVRDLVESLFIDLWLKDDGTNKRIETPDLMSPVVPESESPVTSTSGSAHLSGESIVTPTPPEGKRFDTRLSLKSCDFAAENMMEIVRTAGSSGHLEAMLKKLLDPTASDTDKARKQKDRKLRRELDLKQCGNIVGSLMELLVRIEEDRDTRGVRVGRDLAATLQTIALFAEVSPESLFDSVDTILPYLKADNGVTVDEESAIVAAVCDILHRLTLSLGHSVVDRLASTSVAKDLVQIAYRFSPSAFKPAIQAFSSLSCHQSCGVFGKKLLELGRTFYSFLCKKDNISDFQSAGEKTRNNVHRALTVLGSICEHRADVVDSTLWDDEVSTEDVSLVPAEQLDWSNVVLACYRLFSKFLKKDDTATKCTALRALGGIFSSQPRLLLQLDQEGLIKDLMADQAGNALQLEAIKCWCTILEAEEKRVDGGHAKAKMEANKDITVSKRISGDQDGDATLFGGVLTNHADRLFQLTKSVYAQIRFWVLKCLGLLLRQGLVNPNETVPHLFSLQGDVENDAIRTLSLNLLMVEGEKRPDILRRRVVAGVKQAYEFQVAISKKTDVSATVQRKRGVECIFSTVYVECVAKSRKQRQGFFRNLLGLYKASSASSVSSRGKLDLSLLSFTTQILAYLDYRSLDDPLFIVHEVSSMVTLQGSNTLDAITELLRTVGLASADDCDDNYDVEDALERAARGKFPSRTNEARPLSSKDFDLKQFWSLCRDGMALCLLLRLKAFLRKAYDLSETRCIEYNPANTERLSDKGASRVSNSSPIDCSVPQVLQRKSPIDKDALIRNYAEFRQLMREESNSVLGVGREDSDGDDSRTDRKRSATDVETSDS